MPLPRPSLLPVFIAVGVALLAVQGVRGDEPLRYEACFVDGERVEGRRIVNWHKERSEAKLDDTRLGDPKRPLRWLIDRSLPPADAAGRRGTIELVGGDRLPGRLVDYVAGDDGRTGGELWPHLLVEPDARVGFPAAPPRGPLRVVATRVRRVTWGAAPSAPYDPGTLLFRDGRRLAFRGLRWERGAVRVLTESGPRRVEWRELAEAHLPRIDPWRAYYEELALLSPDGESRLVRLATTDGLRVTGSEVRYLASRQGNSSQPDQWYHLVQPAWCLDPLWLRFSTIRTRSYFAPHEVPLSRIAPEKISQRSALGSGWRPRRDRNVQGGPLRSGGETFAWGIGVQAESRLEFPLAAAVRGFRGRVGLDRLAGEGGCARGEILWQRGDAAPQRLYQSEPLVGSAKSFDSGALQLPATDQPRRLVLLADALYEGAPPGADPLDIRDAIDWLEPLLTLDREALAREVRRSRAAWVPAWKGWALREAGDGEQPFELVNVRIGEGARQRFRVGVLVGDKPLALGRRIRVEEKDRWLLVSASRGDPQSRDALIVRVDGRDVARLDVPDALAPGGPPPLAVPLEVFRGREIDVELIQEKGEKPGPLLWRDVRVAASLPGLRALYEDDLPGGADAGVTFSGDDPYSGRRALRIEAAAPGEPPLVPLPVVGGPLPIRAEPALGEFRYVRFAVRMTNNRGRLLLQWTPADVKRQPLRYVVGAGDGKLPEWPEAKLLNVWGGGSTQWMVVTRDLHGDFGYRPVDLAQVRLTAVDGGVIEVDHVYLARRKEDLERVRVERKLSPPEAVARATEAAFAGALQRGEAALVQIDVDGRFGCGALIRRDGLIATTGYVAGRPGQPARVRFRDGKVVAAKTLGLCRERDVALLRVDEKGNWRHLELAAPPDPQGDESVAVVAPAAPADFETSPGRAVVQARAALDAGYWLALAFRREQSGGLLLDRQGRLVGLVSRGYQPGGALAVPGDAVQELLERLEKGEAWGRWPPGVMPVLPARVAARGGRLEVRQLLVAADKAPLAVGDRLQKVDGRDVRSLQDLVEVLGERFVGELLEVELLRGGEPLGVEVRLVRQ